MRGSGWVMICILRSEEVRGGGVGDGRWGWGMWDGIGGGDGNGDVDGKMGGKGFRGWWNGWVERMKRMQSLGWWMGACRCI